jgi:hypothetical protein
MNALHAHYRDNIYIYIYIYIITSLKSTLSSFSVDWMRVWYSYTRFWRALFCSLLAQRSLSRLLAVCSSSCCRRWWCCNCFVHSARSSSRYIYIYIYDRDRRSRACFNIYRVRFCSCFVRIGFKRGTLGSSVRLRPVVQEQPLEKLKANPSLTFSVYIYIYIYIYNIWLQFVNANTRPFCRVYRCFVSTLCTLIVYLLYNRAWW